MDPKYAALVRHVLWSYDLSIQLANESDRTQGEVDALQGVLRWLQGVESTDLEGLREMFKED